MRNMRLSNLKRKPKSYFKNVRLSNRFSEKSKEYIIRKSFEYLPKYAKEALKSDYEKYVQNILNISKIDKTNKISPYKAFLSSGKSFSGRSANAIRFYSMFRNEAHSVYAKYNSYMYRNGFSASVYFYSNTKYSSRGKIVDISVELPEIIGNVKKYDILTISIDTSDGIVLSAEMK